MYFDIVLSSEPDQNGNEVVNYNRITVRPDIGDIRPKDMSTSNQEKAGVKLKKVTAKLSGDLLNTSDRAESDLYLLGDQIPASDPAPADPAPADPAPADPS